MVIPARDAAATLPALLDALVAQTLAPTEVVVVDDGSTDATAALAAAHPVVNCVLDADGANSRRESVAPATNPRLLFAGAAAGAAVGSRRTARGPGRARNAGVAATTAPLLAFTDADCAPDPGWLAAGVAALAQGPLVQGRVDPARPRSPWERSVAVHAASGLCETANLLVTRALFERAGGFGDGIAAGPERFGGVTIPAKGIAEDTLFAHATDVQALYADASRVVHAGFARGPRAFVAERKRLRHLPALVARAPGLRRTLLRDRLFLTARSRRFDLALLGVAAAVLTRSPLPLAVAAPYAADTRRLARHWPQRPGRRTAAVHLTADAVGAIALLRGSLAARTPVL